MESEEELLSQVKGKLNITWESDDTDRRLKRIMANAQSTLTYKLGLPEGFHFSDPSQENMLFLAWCFYEWNHAVEEFDQNYARDIFQVRAKWEVEYEKKISDL